MNTSEIRAMALPMTSRRIALLTVLPDTSSLLLLLVSGFGARDAWSGCFRKPLRVPLRGPASIHRLLSFGCRMKLRFISARPHPCTLAFRHLWLQAFSEAT